MYIGQVSEPRAVQKKGALSGLSAINPAIALFSPIAAIIAERKKKGLSGLGDEATTGSAGAGAAGPNRKEIVAIVGTGLLVTAALVAAVGVPAYHGYKRNKSVGWGMWWGFMGALFPAPTIVAAVAQGYGKPLKKVRR